eukprot:CAMPEP_0172781234 /NCGR_PEP_ID=MMETSP1074-20121228/203328_1 /TAXON_ID=2916 /ORGANISM="Ceratium fusus, Strain PA161109" /LENGTH=134 /DNA_ID=CAMNT_0013618211 /DNA_START=1069 /DNA_END=1469 /DNA_ORIENTATION=-
MFAATSQVGPRFLEVEGCSSLQHPIPPGRPKGGTAEVESPTIQHCRCASIPYWHSFCRFPSCCAQIVERKSAKASPTQVGTLCPTLLTPRYNHQLAHPVVVALLAHPVVVAVLHPMSDAQLDTPPQAQHARYSG